MGGGGATSRHGHARSVSLVVPSARFLKSHKDFPVLITVPDREEVISYVEDTSYSAPHILFLDYSPPHLLQAADLRYSSDFGFGQLKNKGVLEGKYR